MLLHPHRRSAWLPPPGWGLDLSGLTFVSSKSAPARLRNLAFSPDGSLLTGYDEGTNDNGSKSAFYQWEWGGTLADTTLGDPVKRISSGNLNYCAGYSPDGTRLVSAADYQSSGATVRHVVRDLSPAYGLDGVTGFTTSDSDNRTSWTLAGFRGGVFCDGLRLVLSAHSGTSLRLHELSSAWDLSTAPETPTATLDLASFHGSGDGQIDGSAASNKPVAFCFSPDGSELLAACGGRLYYVALDGPFNLASPALIQSAAPASGFPATPYGVAVLPVASGGAALLVSGAGLLYEYAVPAFSIQQE